jgi:hypothetical protein
MNRGTLRSRVRKKLGETTSAFWTDTELDDYINDGCRDIAFRTKCIRGNTYLTTSDCTQNITAEGFAEISFLSIDSEIYSILEVYFHEANENWIKLQPTSRTELDVLNAGWKDAVGSTNSQIAFPDITYNYQDEAGTPTHYYWDREEDLFGWWVPTETDQVSSDNMRIYYTKQHIDMTSDATVPSIPQALELAIIDYGIAQGLEDRQWLDRGNDRWTKYYARLDAYMAERNREVEDEDLIMKNYRNVYYRNS